MDSDANVSFSQRLMPLPQVRESLLTLLRQRYLSDQLDYLYGFVATGGQHTIKSWLSTQQRESPQEIATLIKAAVSQGA